MILNQKQRELSLMPLVSQTLAPRAPTEPLVEQQVEQQRLSLAQVLVG
jgi:hypothetical protein